MRVLFHSYQLEERKPPFLKREGVLLKFEGERGFLGYANLCSWPELGDSPLEKELEALSMKCPLPLGKRSLEIAKIDARFRQMKKNAFKGLPKPKSHFFAGSIDLDFKDSDFCGFESIKVKIGKNLNREIENLKGFLSRELNLKVRLDFNGSLTEESFLFVLKELKPFLKQFEFFEDPFASDKIELWVKYQKFSHVAFAADRFLDPFIGNPNASAYLIFKPALHDVECLSKASSRQKIVVTSYLSHPLDQAVSAFFAARLQKERKFQVCQSGLLNHLHFKENVFSKMLLMKGNRFIPPSGTGFGFDAALNHLNWTLL